MRILKIVYDIAIIGICISVPVVCFLVQWLRLDGMLTTVIIFLYLIICLKFWFYFIDKLDALDDAEREMNDFLNNE